MNRIPLYILLILVYLGLSKSFSPSEQKTPYLASEEVFTNFFSGKPLSVILVDSFETGFLIKTYFQKYKVVHAFTSPETTVIRTSQAFWNKNLKNIGMSLFRRADNGDESTVPLPPGSLYLGDPAFGTWRYANSGEKIWHFHRTYRQFSRIFQWGNFRPSHRFYEQMRLHKKNNKPFYGRNDEFGRGGKITSKKFKLSHKSKEQKTTKKLVHHFKKHFELPPWKKETSSKR